MLAEIRPIIKPYFSTEILNYQHYISQYVVDHTRVKDGEMGYVVCSEINHGVDPSLLSAAAKVVASAFIRQIPEQLRPRKVIGIPTRGKFFAGALAHEMGLTIGETDRSEVSHDSEEVDAIYDGDDDIITIGGIRSFTKPGKVYSHTIRAIQPGDTVLIADDFSAYGHATEQYLTALKQLNIKPYFVYLIAKDFSHLIPPQIGYRTHKANGVPVFAVVRLTNIIGGTDGKVIAAPDNIVL